MNSYRVTLELDFEIVIQGEAGEEEDVIETAKEYARDLGDWRIRVEDITKKPEEPKEQVEDTTGMVGLFEESEG